MTTRYSEDSDLLPNRRTGRARLEVIFRAYFYLGLTIAIFAIGYFVVSLLNIKLSREQQIALTVAGTGLAVSLFSRWFVTVSRERTIYTAAKLEDQRRLLNLIQTWTDFEVVGKEALRLEDEDVNRRSPKAIIQRLRKEGRLSDADVSNLERAIQVRNAVVHSKASVPPEMVRDAMQTLSDIIEKLSNNRNAGVKA